MSKKNFIYASVVFVLLVLIACVSYSASSASVASSKKYEVGDKDVKTKVKTALENLKGYDKGYYVSNIMSYNDSMSSYIEVVNPNGESYRELPVDDEGNYGIVENISGYYLLDWITEDGDLYNVNVFGDETGTITNAKKFSKSFADYTQSRRYLFIDKMFENLYDFEDGTDITLDVGNGETKYHTYKCKLKGDSVKDILGVDNYVLYNCIIKDYADNKNVVKLCEYYLRDLDMDLTFSDAIITFGVKDNMIWYYELEVGGLGMRMNYSKAVITVSDEFNYRETPDFSKSVDYVTDVMQEDADYIAKFSSYDDAMNALRQRAVDDVSSEESSLNTTESSDSDNGIDVTSGDSIIEETN